MTIDVDIFGGVYVGGNSSLLKYDSGGSLLWKRDSLPTNKLIVYNNQFLYTTGQIYNCSLSLGSYITSKFALDGTLIWSRIYNLGPSTESESYDMVIDHQGNIIVTGHGQYTFLTIKYTLNGDSLWTRRNNQGGIANGIAIDSSDNIFITGRLDDGNTFDYLTIKYSPSGDTLWKAAYSSGGSISSDIAADRTGNVLITGVSCNGGCYTTLKYSNAGSLLWSRSYYQNTSFSPPPNNIILDSLNNAYVSVGGAIPPDTSALRIIKYDLNGNIVWIAYHNLGYGSGEVGLTITLDRLNNLYSTGGALTKCLTVKFSKTLTSIVPVNTEIPKQFSLSQNYPNPFNPNTKIEFAIPKSSLTKLIVYDLTGKVVNTIVNEELNAGTYSVGFDGTNLASGLYFYKLETENYSEIKKMVLLK